MKTSAAGIDLIKTYEGLSLTPYKCPAGVMTIGYGHTGVAARKGLTITKDDADLLLKEDLIYFERKIDELINPTLTQGEFDALVSFTFNVGVGALAESTLRKRLNNGEDPLSVIEEELPRWNKAGGLELSGLAKRRAAEVKLAQTTEINTKKQMQQKSFLEDAAKFYKNLPHQNTAWRALEASVTEVQLKAFKDAYRGSEAPLSAAVSESAPNISKFPLQVPYFYQRDSKTGHGERSCFSSSMAMAIEYLNPEALQGDDDDYLKIVFRYGDTVSSDAQLKAARSLGMNVVFKTNGSELDIIKQLDKGIPVPIGILHKGNISNPSGGGHWICVIGYDKEYFFVHDPFGELDLINGGYPKAGPVDGKFKRYSKKNLMKRWLISSNADGWMMQFK